ncbi:hypothetical protein KC330_g215 [Hortaea werneckii]|nr:hypothetical protein KC330_g215 [Hortaea werneckii]
MLRSEFALGFSVQVCFERVGKNDGGLHAVGPAPVWGRVSSTFLLWSLTENLMSRIRNDWSVWYPGRHVR